jgi:RTX calcium-binding nonapeptide repeat (4 copies)
MQARRMIGRRAILAPLGTGLLVVALAGATPVGAVLPDDGKLWRPPAETTGLTWSQVAQVCPRDGETRCSGSIGARVFTGWVWATADQVVALMGHYAPEILTADPPSVSGDAYFMPGATFTADLRPTFYVSGYGFYHEQTAGWVSSTDEAGLPVAGTVAWGWWPPGGGFDVSGVADAVGPLPRGVWLWRPATDDLTAPVITPSVVGTLGSNGWYVSDVSVSWNVQDPESEISSLLGCDPATVASDTSTTLTCQATSAGGTSTVSAVVKRDTTAPTVTCPSPAPVFEIYRVGAWVTASVSDATSGPAAAPAQGAANTSTPGTFKTTVTGSDRAGNRMTTVCSYQVAIPTCGGLAPTIVGTALNNVINGTSGRDVIVGLGGADTINGNGGDDVICGGDGPDTIDGGDGNDWIDGGASNDSIRGGSGTDTCISGETRMSSCEL